MRISKYYGFMLEGRWKFKSFNDKNEYVFENIFNGTTIILSKKQLDYIKSGKTTIGKIITRRIGAKSKIYTNNTIETFRLQKAKYAKRRDLSK